MCTPVNCKTLARPFGPEGCQVPVGNGVCGEKRTLEFIDEFKRLYETKMQEIDANGGGDCMQEKLRLQQEWIENLIEQNEMLVRAVGELEVEATERVHMLEEKLQKSAQCICEVMNKYRQYDVTSEILTEPLEKIFRLENDQKNLLEFIRRIREDRKWEYEGLSFFEISYRDLFGNDLIENYDKRYLNNNEDQEENKVKIHEGTITELTKRIDYFNSFGNVESMAKDLKCKTDECESLKQSMIDMRQALTEEVASKHDIILQLKREVQQLEEKCIQADKQTAFRDDIVKELRKEIKQLKQQLSLPEKPFKTNPLLPKEQSAKADTCIYINQSKKMIQAGKSTVIYLTHSDEHVKSQSKIYVCSNTKQQTSVRTPELKTTTSAERVTDSKEIKKSTRSTGDKKITGNEKQCRLLSFCKSENDLEQAGDRPVPVKQRSKLTSTTFARHNTFVGSESFKNVDVQSGFGNRNVFIPNHIPVRTYVNNIENNRNKSV